jgi:hypothetical protein
MEDVTILGTGLGQLHGMRRGLRRSPMEPRLLGSILLLMNDWKLTSLPGATLTGWGYREVRYRSQEHGTIRRALATTRELVTLILRTVSR